MKRLFVLIFSLLLLTGIRAQVTIQPNVPVVGLVQKNQLWNMLVINSGATTYDCRIELVLRDRATGQEVFTATTGLFTLAPGAKQLNVNTLNPIQYNYLSNTGTNSLQGLIPAGLYTACYILTASAVDKSTPLAEDCIQFDTEPLSPPMLIFPPDSAELENSPAQFSWIPPTPTGMFDRLQYDVLITEVKEGQKTNEAIQQNLPFYSDGNVFSNFLNYPPSASGFEKDKWYAWQIVARDDRNYAGKSEVWVFKVKTPSQVKYIVEQSPFIKMRKNSPEKGIAPNGVLKIAYRNETNDSMAIVRVTEPGNPSNTRAQFTVALKPGDNLIQYSLKKLMPVIEGNVYQAEIINSRKEKWVVQFEYRNYEETKTKN